MKIIVILLAIANTLFAEHEATVSKTAKVHLGRPKTAIDYPGILRVEEAAAAGTGVAFGSCLLLSCHQIEDGFDEKLEMSTENGSFKTKPTAEHICESDFYKTDLPDHQKRTSDIAILKLKAEVPNSFNETLLDEEFCKTFEAELKTKGPNGKITEIGGLTAGYGPTKWLPNGQGLTRNSQGFIGSLHEGTVKISEGTYGILTITPGPQLPLQGDSGGPIFILDKHNNKKLVGITSAVKNLKMESLAAPVCKHVKWIKAQMQKMGCFKK